MEMKEQFLSSFIEQEREKEELLRQVEGIVNTQNHLKDKFENLEKYLTLQADNELTSPRLDNMKNSPSQKDAMSEEDMRSGRYDCKHESLPDQQDLQYSDKETKGKDIRAVDFINSDWIVTNK